MIKISVCILTLFSLMLVSACESQKGEQGSGIVHINHAFLLAPAPGQNSTALYLDIHNDTNQVLRSLTASSTLSDSIELHTMNLSNGMMSMRKVEQIELKPGEFFNLKPGGYHFMVKALKNNLNEGDIIPFEICLDNKCQAVDVSVKHPVSVNNQKHHH